MFVCLLVGWLVCLQCSEIPKERKKEKRLQIYIYIYSQIVHVKWFMATKTNTYTHTYIYIYAYTSGVIIVTVKGKYWDQLYHLSMTSDIDLVYIKEIINYYFNTLYDFYY